MTHLVDGWLSFDARGFLKVEVDFGAGWVNVTPDLAGLNRQSGRRGPLDRFEASTCSFDLDNTTRDYSPWRTGPHGRPTRNMPVRVTGKTHTGLTIVRFSGYVDEWAELAHPSAFGPYHVCVSMVRVTCTDGFKRLALANGIGTTPAGAGETSGERVERILDAAGWDAAARWVDTGDVTLAETDLSRPALDELHDVGVAEAGLVFVHGDGRFVFFSRTNTSASLDPVATFANDTGGSSIPYGVLEVSDSAAAVRNTVRIAKTGGTEYTAVDAPSVAQDGPLLFVRTDLPLETDAQAEDLAAVLLDRAVNAAFYVAPIEVYPQTGGAEAWRAVVDLGVTNPVTVAHGDIDVGEGFTMLARIDGITDEIRPAFWRTTYRISPIDSPGSYEVIGPPTGLVADPDYTSIEWCWTIPGHGYDLLYVNLDGADWWVELPGDTVCYTTFGLAPAGTYTFCVRGRKGLVDTGATCLTATTDSAPIGPPDPDVDIPPPGATCEWRWYLYELDEDGEPGAPVDSGTHSVALADWVPAYDFDPGVWYGMCWQKWCGEPKAQVGGEACYKWQEPADWEDACTWPALFDPEPVFQIEVCAATDEVRDVVTDTAMTRAHLYADAIPGPVGTDAAILAGGGFDPAPIVTGVLADAYSLGVMVPPILNPALTVGLWVNFDSEPTDLMPLVAIGTGKEWQLVAREDTTEVGVVRFTLSVQHQSGAREGIFFDVAAGTGDQVGIAGWHSVAVTWGWSTVGLDAWARLYIDGVASGDPVELTGGSVAWSVKPHDGFVEWWGEPNSRFAHLAAWDRVLTAEEIEDIWTPAPSEDYDTVVMADGPDAYWPMAGLVDAGAGSAYDARVMADLPVAYWPMNDKTSITYGSYDTAILADSPDAYWKLNQID